MEKYSLEQREKQIEEKLKKAQAWAKKQVPEWIIEGKKHIYDERKKDWEKCVEASATGGLYGRNIETAIEVIKMLDQEGITLDEVFDRFKDAPHLASASLIIFDYSKRGPEFFETILNRRGCEISTKARAALENKKRENRQLAENETKRKQTKKVETQSDDNEQR